ncbi:MAG: DUF2231 domain-containing protein [Methylococcaceae bacterium]|nr:DUF2231 domain-containing protein [Methylococcaceae bacterium]
MYDFPNFPDLSGFSLLFPRVHGGGDDAAGGGLLALLDHLLESISQGADSGSSLQLFPGIQALGMNVHPMFVHFPIAFLSVFFLLEMLGCVLRRERLRLLAGAMLYCGTAGAVLAATAGLYAANTVSHGQTVHEILEWHERLGLTVTFLALILSAWRMATTAVFSAMAQALYLFLTFTMTLCMVLGADLGGLMVYQHGVAVKSLQPTNAQHHHESSAQ